MKQQNKKSQNMAKTIQLPSLKKGKVLSAGPNLLLKKRWSERLKKGSNSNNNDETCPICGHAARSVLMDMHIAFQHFPKLANSS